MWNGQFINSDINQISLQAIKFRAIIYPAKQLQVNVPLFFFLEGFAKVLGMMHSHPNQAGDIINSLDGDVTVGHSYQSEYGVSLPYLIYFPHTSKKGSAVYKISPYYVGNDAKIDTHKSFIKF